MLITTVTCALAGERRRQLMADAARARHIRQVDRDRGRDPDLRQIARAVRARAAVFAAQIGWRSTPYGQHDLMARQAN
jgi:hypothetical protein